MKLSIEEANKLLEDFAHHTEVVNKLSTKEYALPPAAISYLSNSKKCLRVIKKTLIAALTL